MVQASGCGYGHLGCNHCILPVQDFVHALDPMYIVPTKGELRVQAMSRIICDHAINGDMPLIMQLAGEHEERLRQRLASVKDISITLDAWSRYVLHVG